MLKQGKKEEKNRCISKVGFENKDVLYCSFIIEMET